MIFDFDVLGKITNKDTFPDTLGFDDIIEEYNKWIEETIMLSVGAECNIHYKNMLKLPPHRILPFVVEIMREKPDKFWMTDIFLKVCPIIKIDGYVPGNIILKTCLIFWDNLLAFLSPEELDGVCDEISLSEGCDLKDCKCLSKKFKQKIDDLQIKVIEKLGSIKEE